VEAGQEHQHAVVAYIVHQRRLHHGPLPQQQQQVELRAPLLRVLAIAAQVEFESKV
jgi:hypothetical protein